jgi:hypothetical protein
MSRYKLVPDDPTTEEIKITIPNGLMGVEHYTTSNIRRARKYMSRLNKQNISVNSNGDIVLSNGRVLKGVKYYKAIRNAMLGVKKKKYVEFNKSPI